MGATVLYASAAGRERLHTFESDGLSVREVALGTVEPDDTEDVGCAVLTADGSDTDRVRDAVETLRTGCPDLSIVVHSPTPDGELAAVATRAGATDYHHGACEQSLEERVESLLDPATAAGHGRRPEPDRRPERERLSDLLAVSRSLMGAHSTERVASVVGDAIESALGYDLSVVRLYDGDSHSLVPYAASIGEADDGRPACAVGEGGPGTAFERGETLVLERDHWLVDDDAVDDLAAVAYVPLGQQGVMSVLTRHPDAFDETDRSLLEVLASNAAVALDRVEREERLVRYRSVVENVQDMVYVIDEEGNFLLVTEPLADWLGYERSELIGSDPTTVVSAEATEEFEAEIADMWHSGTGSADPSDESRTIQTRFITASGDRRPAEVEVSLLPPSDGFTGSVGVVRDRTELVEARKQLEDQRDRFSYLFDNIPDAVVEVSFDDARPIVESVNPAFSEVFGYDPETVRGNSLNEYVVPAERQQSAHQLDARAAEGEAQQRQLRRKTLEGYRDFLFRGIPYETTDEESRGFGIYTDITEQKERERRLEVLNRVLRHNLRNDLNVVLGYADMLVEDATDDTAARRAETLREKAGEIAALSERARRLDRTIDRGSARDRSIGLDRVVEDAVATMTDRYPELSVETDVRSVTVVGDSRLQLAVHELLENVAEHTTTPGQDDSMARARIETIDIDDETLVGLRVADDGPGIPKNERTVISEADEITQLHHGTGLGLWIVKWICESCGGHVYFGESPLGGSAVVLELSRE